MPGTAARRFAPVGVLVAAGGQHHLIGGVALAFRLRIDADHRCVRYPPRFSPSVVDRSQTAMKSAATTGPMTNPLMPNRLMPPRVEMSTT